MNSQYQETEVAIVIVSTLMMEPATKTFIEELFRVSGSSWILVSMHVALESKHFCQGWALKIVIKAKHYGFRK